MFIIRILSATFYADLLSQSDEPVTILSIGGASNFGLALPAILQKPKLKAKINRIFIMGGAVDVGGHEGALAGNMDGW